MENNNIEMWLNADIDKKIKDEINKMTPDQKKEAFGFELEFGTAGMRGIMGTGSSKMNKYTIRRATAAFAKHLLESFKDAKDSGIVIGHDNRHNSKEFCMEAAGVLASYGIRSFLFKDNELRPTPLVSFTCAKIKAAGAIIVTASHNPKEYNGYKVYDPNGCQLTDEIDNIYKHYQEIVNPFTINSDQDSDLINFLDEKYELDYLKDTLDIKNKDLPNNITLTYTAQHGTGITLIPEVMKRAGIKLDLVKEQCVVDPNFSKTIIPNPEDPRAFELAIKYAKKAKSDIIVSNDPDSDRLGVMVLHNGEYVFMSGNETAAVLMDYWFKYLKDNGNMPANPMMLNTIVTSTLGEKVANKHGVSNEKTLTGFKWMGKKIAKFKKEKGPNVCFAYEESFGYMVKDSVRDKDGIQATLLCVDCASYFKTQNKTMIDALNDLKAELGYFTEKNVSIVHKGIEGKKLIEKIMIYFRENSPKEFAGIEVKEFDDYLKGIKGIPSSNVLKYHLKDGSWIAMRPSGTEPKIKFYYCIIGDSQEESAKKQAELEKFIDSKLKEI